MKKNILVQTVESIEILPRVTAIAFPSSLLYGDTKEVKGVVMDNQLLGTPDKNSETWKEIYTYERMN